jgi:ubiquinone/menaquinone biosynthesis C-methylase UbiE
MDSMEKMFVCPECKVRLQWKNGWTCAVCRVDYPVINGIPRFVPAANYCNSFGRQWHLHAKTQLDKYNGTTISRERFQQLTGWDVSALHGRKILEVGSGAGRFTQIMHDAGAEIWTVDYSTAIEVNKENNGDSDRLHYFQADMYQLPLSHQSFDWVVCVNVLQHTPDVRKAFNALCEQVRPGGQLAVTVYKKTLKSMLNWKYFMRPFTIRMNPNHLYRIIAWVSPFLLAVSRFTKRWRLVYAFTRRIIPVHDYMGMLPLNEEEFIQWSILDTFDSLSPRYDTPQKPGILENWFRENGFSILRSADSGCTVTGQRKPT